MAEETGGVRTFIEVRYRKMAHESAVGDATDLLETVHASSNADINITILVDVLSDIVVIEYDLREEAAVNAHVLGFIELVAEVEVGEVNGGGTTIGRREHLVDRNFESGEVTSACTGVTMIVQAITAHSEADAVGVSLLGTIVGDDTQVSDLLGRGNVRFVDELKSVAPFGDAGDVGRGRTGKEAGPFFGTS